MEGILIVEKEIGCTSHDVVSSVKKICHEKVGHTGTLDPMATGVLPLLIGEGTKLSKYLIEHDKEYEAVIQLGIRTDTADTEGSKIEECRVNLELLNEQNLNFVLHSLVGKQLQKPPMYSAIKIKGKKLYEYARKDEIIEVPERQIEIYKMELMQINSLERTIQFCVHCSKGPILEVYVRQ